jgi:hypothetical protein
MILIYREAAAVQWQKVNRRVHFRLTKVNRKVQQLEGSRKFEMEPVMKRLVILATIATALAAPVTAQSLSVLLPALSFPEPAPTPSTKNCAPSMVACQPGQ